MPLTTCSQHRRTGSIALQLALTLSLQTASRERTTARFPFTSSTVRLQKSGRLLPHSPQAL